MRVANTRWTREDIGMIATMRERHLTWAQVAEHFDCSSNSVKWAWRYFWLQALRRYERTL